VNVPENTRELVGLRGAARRAWLGELEDLSAFGDMDRCAAQRFAERAAELFSGTPAAVYRPTRAAGGFDVHFFAASGLGVSVEDEYRSLLRSTQPSDTPFNYDPTRPAVADRNSVRTLQACELHRLSPAAQVFFERQGLARADQTRAVLARGSTLLGWIGIFRERSGATALRDAWLVKSLARAARGRCRSCSSCRPEATRSSMPPSGHWTGTPISSRGPGVS
jgi:hypothetical protein